MTSSKQQSRISAACMRTSRILMALAAIILLPAVLAAQSAQTPAFTVLYAFTGGADAGNPQAGVVPDHAGKFYGTSFYGGASGRGTVFEVDTSGAETVLYSFTGGADGDAPSARLLRDESGNLFGTAMFGGNPNCAGGCGTIFKLSPTSQFTLLYSFQGGPSDGAYPASGLIRDRAGNLYGTTFRGGTGGTGGSGTVFELDVAGKETVLHSFSGKDGVFCWGGLVRDSAGNLYGDTYTGGAYDRGTVFKVSKRGKETVLHSFYKNSNDGANPYRGLILDSRGNLYGVTGGGGAHNNGTVFRMSKTGKETILYSFTGGAEGGQPRSGLTQDDQGNLYGTTWSGGAYGDGVVFKVTKSGKETVLYSFTGAADGMQPNGLTRDALGVLYGTTTEGGNSGCFNNYGCGVLFKLTP